MRLNIVNMEFLACAGVGGLCSNVPSLFPNHRMLYWPASSTKFFKYSDLPIISFHSRNQTMNREKGMKLESNQQTGNHLWPKEYTKTRCLQINHVYSLK